MASLRTFAHRWPLVGLVLLAAAMALRLAAPAGFMPQVTEGRIALSICTGHGAVKARMVLPRAEHEAPAKKEATGKADQPCIFAGMAKPMLAAADPVLLAIALLLVLALGLRRLDASSPRSVHFLQPPATGPPAIRR